MAQVITVITLGPSLSEARKTQVQHVTVASTVHLTGFTTDEKVFESFGGSIVFSSRRFLRKATRTKGVSCLAGPLSKIGYTLPAGLLLTYM